MKKTFILVCLSAMALSLAGCVEQTELSGETTITIKCDYVEASVDLKFIVVN